MGEFSPPLEVLPLSSYQEIPQISLFLSPKMTLPPLPGATQVWFGEGRAAETWEVDPFLYMYQILQKN